MSVSHSGMNEGRDCVWMSRFFNIVFPALSTVLGTYWMHNKYLLKEQINIFANFLVGSSLFIDL